MSSKSFVGIWYPDEDPSHMFALSYLQTVGLPHVYIVHDRDLDDNGQLKKKHCHVFFKFRQERYIDNVALLLGIKSNYIQECIDEKGSLRYFLHADHPNKFQYRIDQCRGTLVDYVERCVASTNPSDRMFMLLNVLDSLPCPVTYRSFLVAACEAGLYNEFRRLGAGARDLVEEKNFDKYSGLR